MKDAQEVQLELVTPEHVPLPFTIASAAQRVLALVVDLLVMLLLLLVTVLVLGLGLRTGDSSGDYAIALFVLAAFVLRNFYFTFAELRWQGQTLGKRVIGIRVVARDGGPLTPAMVATRNLTRDVELFLPMVLLLVPSALLGSYPSWARTLAFGWLFLAAFVPFFNRHRARIGDLLAGTVVVMTPKASLLPDLVDPSHAGGAPAYRFSREQLEIYGIVELQTLEEVLRRADVRSELLEDIAARVQRKIRWAGDRSAPEAFLRAFYEAQRGRLEQKMLLGRRQERKRG